MHQFPKWLSQLAKGFAILLAAAGVGSLLVFVVLAVAYAPKTRNPELIVLPASMRLDSIGKAMNMYIASHNDHLPPMDGNSEFIDALASAAPAKNVFLDDPEMQYVEPNANLSRIKLVQVLCDTYVPIAYMSNGSMEVEALIGRRSGKGLVFKILDLDAGPIEKQCVWQHSKANKA